jgi:hypothetical protein
MSRPRSGISSAIGELIATYKTTFKQEAVLQVRANVCMAL